ncbi:MAG: hypothetical protein O3A84_01955 [Proteobacteria bacterium]|nr:hypothetical protein [Pseudomonadota bacterium]
MTETCKFFHLSGGDRYWAIGAIHGDVEKLQSLHAQLMDRLEPADRLVYLGNFLGIGSAIQETVDELLLFRRLFLAQPRAFVQDIAYLRGSQEEMWQKLLQIHLAMNPAEVLGWMFEQGAAATLAAYGGRAETGLAAVREGAMALNRWAADVRDRIRSADGHNALMSILRRAAYTGDDGLLFVNSGLDPSKPLDNQKDNFWWGNVEFDKIKQPYGSFKKVIRGFDPKHRGMVTDGVAITVDSGCGFGGGLTALCFDADGNVLDRIDA